MKWILDKETLIYFDIKSISVISEGSDNPKFIIKYFNDNFETFVNEDEINNRIDKLYAEKVIEKRNKKLKRLLK